MKIALFSDTFLPIADGVGRVAVAYAKTLSDMGHQVSVSAPMMNFGFRGGLEYDLIEYLSVEVPTVKQYRGGTPVLDTHYLKRMAMSEFDIVHAHSPFVAGHEALRISRQRGIPLIASFHSKYYDDFYKLTQNRALSQMMTASVVSFYNKCDEVWAVSESTAEVLYSYGYKKKIYVMPNGVELRQADEDFVMATKNKYVKGDEKILLFVGQMNWKKNILRVLEAAKLLKDEGFNFKLLFAGQGPDRDKIVLESERMDLYENCFFLGHIEDSRELDALYSIADLFVFPSLYDNAPMVVREAAVMKTPSVLVRGSCAAEIIKDGENGFLCEDEAQSLAGSIKAVFSMPKDELQKIGERARAEIPVRWESILAEAVKRYERLIESFKSDPPKRVIRAEKRLARRMKQNYYR